jgi:hypothetical protein
VGSRFALFKSIKPYGSFGLIQVVSDRIVKPGAVSFNHAFENAAMPIKRQGRCVSAVKALNAIAQHVTAKSLNEIDEPLASARPCQDFMKLSVQLRKDREISLLNCLLGLSKVFLQCLDLFRPDAGCSPIGGEGLDHFPDLDDFFDFIPIDLPHPIPGSGEELQKSLFCKKVEGLSDGCPGNANLLGQSCLNQYGIFRDLAVDYLVFYVIVDFFADRNWRFYFEFKLLKIQFLIHVNVLKQEKY